MGAGGGRGGAAARGATVTGPVLGPNDAAPEDADIPVDAGAGGDQEVVHLVGAVVVEAVWLDAHPLAGRCRPVAAWRCQ